MKRVAEALTVSRSRLAERVKEAARGRSPHYSKAEDEVLLPLIRDIIDHRLTYGYRRVCAMLNRRLVQDGHVRVNHKRVYRIMRLHGLLLARHKGYRLPSLPYGPSRKSAGKGPRRAASSLISTPPGTAVSGEY